MGHTHGFVSLSEITEQQSEPNVNARVPLCLSENGSLQDASSFHPLSGFNVRVPFCLSESGSFQDAPFVCRSSGFIVRVPLRLSESGPWQEAFVSVPESSPSSGLHQDVHFFHPSSDFVVRMLARLPASRSRIAGDSQHQSTDVCGRADISGLTTDQQHEIGINDSGWNVYDDLGIDANVQENGVGVAGSHAHVMVSDVRHSIFFWS